MAQEAVATLIGEEDGQALGFRVLPDEGTGARVEVSAQGKGKVLGQDSTSMVTFVQVMRPDGTLYGEGRGIAFLDDGSRASFTGTGVGVMKAPGGPVHWKATLHYHNATGKLAKLVDHPVFTEYNVDENWKTHAMIYEWKETR